ncbi:MAG: DUF4173 domain-containing protein [Crocinitomicaceae bacterium]|nr:DUF4173 domain-containing protein [Crocinitomicaceae bacterium]
MERIKNYIYLGWVLVIANMYYQEYFGLNALIVSLVSIPIFGFLKQEYLIEPKWWFMSGIFAASGLAVFLQASVLSIFLYFFTALVFIATQIFLKHSLPIGIIQSVQAFGSGFYYYFENLFTIGNSAETKRKKVMKNVLLVLIPILVAIIFLKLYQSADETFKAYTEWINLDWISWGFLGFYLVLTLFLYGFYYARKDEIITAWEEALKNDINEDYTDGIQRAVGVKNETKVAIALLITLNAFLLLYNIIDVSFVSTKLFNHGFESSYSQVVHGGINALITSIILVILLLTYMFRGQLNFQGSKWIKRIAAIWLIQNLVMISTTLAKNWEYVSHWGLTYKRIGVFVYLFLAVIGIGLTIYKLFKVQSFWFLLRTTSISFLTFFVVFACFSWDRIIAEHNLTHVAKERIDLDYILDLGSDALPALIQYHQTTVMDEYYETDLIDFARYSRDRLASREERSTWRSLNMTDKYVLAELRKWPDAFGPYDSFRGMFSYGY